MIEDHLDILRGECETIVKEERREDMHNIYLLLRGMKNGINAIVNVFREQIKQHGIQVIGSVKQEQVYFQ